MEDSDGPEAIPTAQKKTRADGYARPITLMQPERLEDPPPWVGHIPFAFWIVDVMRPRRFVELGTHSGNSFAAFVQAGLALSVAGEFFAVDHWQGDRHSFKYGEEIYQDLKHYMDVRYAGRANLLRMSFDEALPRFEDGSIDLLHIDGLHTYEAVKHDFESWLPKMSDRGVVLLHDTAVRENDFGVYRLMDELSDRFRTFEFAHSHGLGVVQTGSKAPKSLETLLKAEADGQGFAPRDYFGKLGRTLVERFYLEKLLGQHIRLETVEAELATVSRRKQEIEAALDGLRSEAGFTIRAFRQQMRNNVDYGETEELARLVLASGYFDAVRYREVRGLADHDDLALAKDYLAIGEGKGIRPSDGFDPAFYARRNPDVADAGMGMLEHYLRYGRFEARLPKAPENEDRGGEQPAEIRDDAPDDQSI